MADVERITPEEAEHRLARGEYVDALDVAVSLDALEDWEPDEDEHYDEPGPLGASWQ